MFILADWNKQQMDRQSQLAICVANFWILLPKVHCFEIPSTIDQGRYSQSKVLLMYTIFRSYFKDYNM